MLVAEGPAVCEPPVPPGPCSRPCNPLRRAVGVEGDLPGGWRSLSESCGPGCDAVAGGGGEEDELTDWVEAGMLSCSASVVGGRPLQRMFAGRHPGRCRRLREVLMPTPRRQDSLVGSCDCDSLEGS